MDYERLEVCGFQVEVSHKLGHLAVCHNGDIRWDELQAIKNTVWGESANAVEVYPDQAKVINSINCRHLWRLGEHDFCPDLMGDTTHQDSMAVRFGGGWSAAWLQFGGKHG